MATRLNASLQNLTLFEKWALPTRLVASYRTPALRNALASLPGILPVLFLAHCLRRNKGMLAQYKYTIVYLTFGGYMLMMPVSIFNYAAAIITTSSEEGGIYLNTPVWACSLAKSGSESIMSCSLCIGVVIAFNRYLVLIRNIDLGWRGVSILSTTLMSPNLLYLLHLLLGGVLKGNDCCEIILGTPHDEITFIYYGYLLLVVYASCAFNVRTLAFLFERRRMQKMSGILRTESQCSREQWNLTVGLVVQSIAPALSFTSWLVYMAMYMFGVLGPAWFATTTNFLNYASTFINPIASMAFVPVFRREFLRLLSACRIGGQRRYTVQSGLASFATMGRGTGTLSPMETA